jgi:uncharacterized protein YjbI with pentapeptide repeats
VLSVKPTTDVQAAINVLGRLPQRSGVSRGDLSAAFLAHAGLRGANLSGAALVETYLAGAVLEGADLSGAVLHGVDLWEAYGLTQAQLDTARGDASTRLPDGLRRPASWEAEERSTASSP